MVGTRVAGYTIKREVGEGGTSAVYLADHPNHGTVALKVLREKLRQDKTAVARFIREYIGLFAPDPTAADGDFARCRHQVGDKPLTVNLLVRAAWSQKADHIAAILQHAFQ